MDQSRMLELAGISTSLTEDLNKSIEELDLLEKMYQGRNNLNIDTDVMPIEDIQKRLDAASRALGLVNRLRDPAMKKQHLSRVMSNMNTIRAALMHAVKQMEDAEEPMAGPAV